MLFKSASDTNLQKGTSFLDYLSDKHLGKISEDESSGLVYKSGSGEVSHREDVSCTDSDSVLSYRDDSNRLSLNNSGNQNAPSNALAGKGSGPIESIFRAEDFLPEVPSVPENLEDSKEVPTARSLKSQPSLR